MLIRSRLNRFGIFGVKDLSENSQSVFVAALQGLQFL
jgi:hypothetical protein